MSWFLRILGNNNEPLEVDKTHRAARWSARPLDHGALGHYRISVVTGTLAAALAANAQVAQFKNPTANPCLILGVRTRFQPLTPFTPNTLTDHSSFDMVVARPYGAGGGGTTLTLTGNNAKVRSSGMATCGAVINVATTAALTLATGLDAHPFAQSIRKGNRVNPAAATEEVIQPTTDGLEYKPDVDRGEHPLTLAQNEGFVIRNRTVWPAAGTGILLFEVSWAEIASYNNAQLG